MKKSTKIISIVVVVIAIGAVITFTSLKSKRRKEEKEALLKAIEEQKNLTEQQLKDLKDRLENASETEQLALKEELLTDIGNVKVGKFAYPKGASVNVRTSAKVNNGLVNNLIYENYKKKVGIILSVVKSDEYGDKNKWYKVKLTEPFDGWTFDATEGYVREDQITVKNM